MNFDFHATTEKRAISLEFNLGRLRWYWSVSLAPRNKRGMLAAAYGPRYGVVAGQQDEDEAGPTSAEQWEDVRIIQDRADRLLRETLTLEQVQALDTTGAFELVGNLGHRYRLHQGSTRNVAQLDAEGKVVRWLCAAPPGVPDGDAMLAQKLLLETDELAFAFIARPSVPRPRQAEVGPGPGAYAAGMGEAEAYVRPPA